MHDHNNGMRLSPFLAMSALAHRTDIRVFQNGLGEADDRRYHCCKKLCTDYFPLNRFCYGIIDTSINCDENVHIISGEIGFTVLSFESHPASLNRVIQS